MLVCRRWRGLIISHACFWSTIIAKGRLGWLRLALSRSKTVILRSVNPRLRASGHDTPPRPDTLSRAGTTPIICASHSPVFLDSSPLQIPYSTSHQERPRLLAGDRSGHGIPSSSRAGVRYTPGGTIASILFVDAHHALPRGWRERPIALRHTRS